MNLHILRHGIAVERGAPGYEIDRDRPLTPEGERKLERIAEALRELKLSPDLILSSPYLRARQTAEIVARAFRAKKRLELCEYLSAEGDPRKLISHLNRLQPAPESVLLVGHEPYLSEMISLLVTGRPGMSMELKKGGCGKLTITTLRPGRCATLDWLLTPRLLLRMT